jgi:hypothetical protein
MRFLVFLNKQHLYTGRRARAPTFPRHLPQSTNSPTSTQFSFFPSLFPRFGKIRMCAFSHGSQSFLFSEFSFLKIEFLRVKKRICSQKVIKISKLSLELYCITAIIA